MMYRPDKLESADKRLIQGSIDLGNWLLNQDSVDQKQRKIIQDIQRALIRLPEPTLGIDGKDYGFVIQNKSIAEWDQKTMPPPEGVVMGWSVDIYQREEDGLQKMYVEIGNFHTTWTNQTYEEFKATGIDHEMEDYAKELLLYGSFWSESGKIHMDISKAYGPTLVNEWVQATHNPDRLLNEHNVLEIEISEWGTKAFQIKNNEMPSKGNDPSNNVAAPDQLSSEE